MFLPEFFGCFYRTLCKCGNTQLNKHLEIHTPFFKLLIQSNVSVCLCFSGCAYLNLILLICPYGAQERKPVPEQQKAGKLLPKS